MDEQLDRQDPQGRRKRTPMPEDDEFVAALRRLMEIAQGHRGTSKRIAALLLGLYNGDRFPFNLNYLRCLDGDVFEDCMTVLRRDANRWEREVHEYFQGGGEIFEQLALRWRIADRRA